MMPGNHPNNCLHPPVYASKASVLYEINHRRSIWLGSGNKVAGKTVRQLEEPPELAGGVA
ncbi:hypothetical protein SAMN05192553_10917 [Cyclobacterium xiamenense]|uniref:Uncharacterized protein n=1 Tax=Cyclobacterium xiamenense TaxID=1297121 RepID=A0A1H7B886_9BACT|nr:hypothetical protein [Cyclobacterium xiamenense]SEJ70500.1 hypothetical protein SAMN05192553_10917 [Cyclobacterium xiamenense]